MAQEQTAKVLELPQDKLGKYKLYPGQHIRMRGDGRAIAVAKFRELADKLESGELDGARVQWMDTHGLLVETLDGRRFDLVKQEVPEVGQLQPLSGLEYVTRTAWTETGEGRVGYVACWIEEVK